MVQVPPSVYDIFVSYRRGDAGWARNICSGFPQRWRVFRDAEVIEKGDLWQEKLNHALKSARIFVAIIGKEWAPERIKKNPADWVGYEIAAALSLNIPIFLAIVPGGQLPNNKDLPDGLEAFTDREAFPIRDDPDFETDVARLYERIDREYREANPPRPRDAVLALVSEFISQPKWEAANTTDGAEIHTTSAQLNGNRAALAVGVAVTMACILSILGQSASLTIALSSRSAPLSFGYLEELNAGPLYLSLVPLFVLLAFRFLRSVQSSLVFYEEGRWLSTRDGSSRGIGGETPDSPAPIRLISSWNRRLFRIVMVPLLLVGFWAVIWTEIGKGGDYWHLAFGYVQAVHLPSYPRQVSIAQFEKQTDRTIKHISGVPDDSLEREKWIIERIDGGPKDGFQKVAFYLFLAIHLLLEWLFACFVAWIVIKAAFVLWLIYSSIRPSGNHQIELGIDLLDRDNVYGLGWFNSAWKLLLALILIGTVTTVTTLVANFAKGSWRPSDGGEASAVLGQTLVAAFGFILAAMLGVYMFLLWLKVDAAKHDALEQRRKVSRQRFPIDAPLILLLTINVLAYPVLLVLDPRWTIPVAKGWTTFVQHFGG